MSSFVLVKLNSAEPMMPHHGSSRSNASAKLVVLGILKFGSIVSTAICATLEPSTSVPEFGISGFAPLNTGACFTYEIWPAAHAPPVAGVNVRPLVEHSSVPAAEL